MSIPGALGPEIIMVSNKYFLFSHNHEGSLKIDMITGHVLCVLVMSPKGFIPSVLKANLMFLGCS
jgi:hypothetical protein